MAHIIKEKQRIELTSYSLEYEWNDVKGAGFSFPCDEKGNLITEGLTKRGLENYNACSKGEKDVKFLGIQKNNYAYTEPAILECDCGDKLSLSGFTNTCQCGTDYNMSGQRLASRRHWGEETGEKWHECY
ncbi:hypothetical protein M5X17_31275 [Paenibacillus alvei]|uniref:hypothetical protein n=1 Tax=Paenibacillus alvei TaxID=44250 RepID=UPI002282CCCA|nr:hypothetical protein [Paenibacillus alvei]MCY9738176.1 hypothetical protein [Paenibacillus alvei]